MSRRSITNDRYRVERGGKTRKSASAAKPKRAAGEAASSAPSKADKPKSALGRAVSKGQGHARKNTPAPPRIEQDPAMKKLRRYWWWCLGGAAVLLAAYFGALQLGNRTLITGILAAYVTVIAAAFYLEWGPIRRLRKTLTAEAKTKKAKGAK